MNGDMDSSYYNSRCSKRAFYLSILNYQQLMKVFTLLSRLTMIACVLFAVSSCEEDFSANRGNNGKGSISIDGEMLGEERSYILVAKTDLPKGLEKSIAELGGEITSTTPQIGMAVVKSSNANFAKRASSISGIQDVVPDFKLQWLEPSDRVVELSENTSPPNTGDDDFFFDLQWGHDAVDAPEAWAEGYRGKDVKVAVLDGGFDLDHPDLLPNINPNLVASFVPGEDALYRPERNEGSNFSHGTHVAGTVAAADNSFGIVGVAPEAELMLIKVLADAGSGAFSWINAGIVYAADKGADVINMSLGAYIPTRGAIFDENGVALTGADIQVIIRLQQRAVTYAYQKGVTVISSAGNDTNNGQKDGSAINLPADLAHVVNISSTAPIGWATDPTATNLDNLASYSNFGNTIDFAAPGGDFVYPGNEVCVVAGLARPCWVFDLVFSTSNGGWSWSAGTSMASPHAAGVAALIIEKNGGDMSPAQVEAVLKQSADDIFKPGFDPYSGAGRVNAYNAVK
jgi:subtilisin family serine protease